MVFTPVKTTCSFKLFAHQIWSPRPLSRLPAHSFSHHLQLPSQCVLCHAPLPPVYSRPGLPLVCVSLFYSERSYTATKPLCRLCLICLLTLLLGIHYLQAQEPLYLAWPVPLPTCTILKQSPLQCCQVIFLSCASSRPPCVAHQSYVNSSLRVCSHHSFLDPCLLSHLPRQCPCVPGPHGDGSPRIPLSC